MPLVEPQGWRLTGCSRWGWQPRSSQAWVETRGGTRSHGPRNLCCSELTGRLVALALQQKTRGRPRTGTPPEGTTAFDEEWSRTLAWHCRTSTACSPAGSPGGAAALPNGSTCSSARQAQCLCHGAAPGATPSSSPERSACSAAGGPASQHQGTGWRCRKWCWRRHLLAEWRGRLS